MPDENSKNRPKSPGAKSYFEALRGVFDLQAQVLTNALPHYGERGRNDEERFRAFLSNTLPRKYGVATGFVIASDDRTSKQIDVVIFDELQNAPLHREMAAFVFPVEMVYATIEVKGRIRPKLLSGCLGNIESVRSLTSSKVYGVPAVMAVEGKPGKGKAVTLQMPDSTAPRAFVVAYDAAGWKDVTAFANSWAAALGGRGAHLHGVLVIRKNWYIAQHTYQDRVRLSV